MSRTCSATIHETTGWAVYFSIEHREKEKVQSREPSASGAGAKAKKAAPAAKPALSTDAKAAATGEVDQEAWNEVYDDLMGEQETKIQELEKQLKAYEEKYGKL